MPWHLWARRDGGAVDLGELGSEAAARDAAARATEHQKTKGLASLGVAYEAHPAGYEPPGYGRVRGLEKSREEKWPPKPVLFWRDDHTLPLCLREGKTERRDARLSPQLEAADRARRAADRSVNRSPPPGLSSLVAALANPPQRRGA